MARAFQFAATAFIGSCVVTAFGVPGLHSQSVVANSRSFTLTDTIHIPPAPAGSTVLRLWIPIPYEESSQGTGKVKIDGAPGWKMHIEQEYRNRYAYAEITGAALSQGGEIKASFQVQRFEHRVALTQMDDEQGAPTMATLRFLRPDRLVPIDGEIAGVSNRQAGETSLPLEKAKRLYNYVGSTMAYDPANAGPGSGDALATLDAKRGACADIDSLFIAVARSNGIPARFEIGFAIPTDSHAGAVSEYSCWAQIYAGGIGWVPVDAVEGGRHPELREYYFGALDDNRVKMTAGRDMELNPQQRGEPLNYFLYPYAELDGKPYAGITNDYSFQDDPGSASAGTKPQ